MQSKGLFGSVKRKIMKRFLGPDRLLDLGLRFGPYGSRLKPFSKGLTLRKVKKSVHGIDLGPLTSCLPGRLRTADKQIELAPEVLVRDVERVNTKFEQEFGVDHASPHSNGHLLLIGRRQLRSNNSWMHNSERLLRGKPQCTILMHPKDAAHRHLTKGQSVSVRSNAGSVHVPLEITEDMMPGVVSIPHGWGHDRLGVQLGIAQQHAGESINDVTDDQAIDTLCGTAAFNGTWVTVETCIESSGD
jgi:anaerobic selenocysteine-containing dehydrogenase